MTSVCRLHLHRYTVIWHLSAGYISADDAPECTPCPAGYACPDNKDPTANIQCSPGTYSLTAELICAECPAGSACPDIT